MTKPAYITAWPLPVADFTANQTSGVVPLAVLFTDTSANGPFSLIKWERRPTGTIPWTEFGSGAPNPTEIFSTTGDYDIQLTVTNSAGPNTKTIANYIHVTAVPVSHTITASAVGGGTITPSGAVIVNDGGSQTFTITPNAGYTTASVLVDGVAQVPVPGSYTFTNVIADHTISATFTANTPVDIFYDDFESTRPSGNLWTETGSVDWGGYTPRIGNRDVRLRSDEAITRTISTAGYTGITVSFSLAAYSLDSPWPGFVPEYVQASWYNGATWTELTRISDGDANEDNALHPYSFSLPAGAANNPNFALRFLINGSNDSDYGYVDNVRVTGTHT
jgi:PKD repeat protein